MPTKLRDTLNSVGLLILRLGIGGFMATHGYGKLQMVLNGEYAKFGDPIGLGNQASLILAMTSEFICAILVMIGLGTRLAAIGPVVAMSVAAFVAHKADPWTMTEGARLFMSGESKSWASKEPALLFLIPFLALIFTGAGQFSLDGLIFGKRRSNAPTM